jgi:hypothetical protein
MPSLAVLDAIVDNAGLLTALFGFIGAAWRWLVRLLVGEKPVEERSLWIVQAVSLLVAAAIAAFAFAPWELIGEPRLRLTETPPKVIAAGPTETLHPVAGRIENLVNPRRFKLVLYAFTDRWYAQPVEEQPYTDVSATGVFTTETHDGEKFALLLVRPGYAPRRPLDALPPTGRDVIAIMRFEGREER